jgi:hypothetical protein
MINEQGSVREDEDGSLVDMHGRHSSDKKASSNDFCHATSAKTPLERRIESQRRGCDSHDMSDMLAMARRLEENRSLVSDACYTNNHEDGVCDGDRESTIMRNCALDPGSHGKVQGPDEKEPPAISNGSVHDGREHDVRKSSWQNIDLKKSRLKPMRRYGQDPSNLYENYGKAAMDPDGSRGTHVAFDRTKNFKSSNSNIRRGGDSGHMQNDRKHVEPLSKDEQDRLSKFLDQQVDGAKDHAFAQEPHHQKPRVSLAPEHASSYSPGRYDNSHGRRQRQAGQPSNLKKTHYNISMSKFKTKDGEGDYYKHTMARPKSRSSLQDDGMDYNSSGAHDSSLQNHTRPDRFRRSSSASQRYSSLGSYTSHSRNVPIKNATYSAAEHKKTNISGFHKLIGRGRGRDKSNSNSFHNSHAPGKSRSKSIDRSLTRSRQPRRASSHSRSTGSNKSGNVSKQSSESHASPPLLNRKSSTSGSRADVSFSKNTTSKSSFYDDFDDISSCSSYSRRSTSQRPKDKSAVDCDDDYHHDHHNNSDNEKDDGDSSSSDTSSAILLSVSDAIQMLNDQNRVKRMAAVASTLKGKIKSKILSSHLP